MDKLNVDKYLFKLDSLNLNINQKRQLIRLILENGGGSGGNIEVDSELSQTSTNPVQNKVITNTIGDLSLLDNIVKDTNLVAAINKTAKKFSILNNNIGNLNNLQTTDKTNVVNAINEVKKQGGGGGKVDRSLDRVIPLYKQQNVRDFAIPVNGNPNDLILFNVGERDSKFRRVVNGVQKWEMQEGLFYEDLILAVDSYINIVGNYIYAGSCPHGIFKISLNDGSYLNNRTPYNYVERIGVFGGKIYAIAKLSSIYHLVIYDVNDLTILNDETIDIKPAIKGPMIRVYADRILICCKSVLKVFYADGTHRDYQITDGATAFFLPYSIFVRKGLYIIYKGDLAAYELFDEDNGNRIKGNVTETPNGSEEWCDVYISYTQNGWTQLNCVAVQWISTFMFKGNSALERQISTPFNLTQYNGNQRNYPYLYKGDGYYVLNKNGVIYMCKSLI